MATFRCVRYKVINRWYVVIASFLKNQNSLFMKRKKPGTRPGEVQQGGEGDKHKGIIAFTGLDRVR